MHERRKGLWLKCFAPRPAASVRLVCFPHAAAGAGTYRTWCSGLPEWIEVHCVQLPGRDVRLREPALRSVRDVARALLPVLREELAAPYALFGHSMGAALAFEHGLALERGACSQLAHVFVSGRGAPHVPATVQLHRLGADALVRALHAYGETPPSVLYDRDLLAALLPTIRADFETNETYLTDASTRLACPLTVLGGSRDPFVLAEHIEQWAQHTSGPCNLRWFEGGHFFVRERQAQVLATIASALEPVRDERATARRKAELELVFEH